ERLAALQRAAIAQGVVRRAVGEEKGGTGDEVHLLRQGQEARRLRFYFLGERAIGREGDDPVTRPHVRHARSDFLYDAGQLAARREGQRRLELVLVLDDEHVGKIDARCFLGDADFT